MNRDMIKKLQKLQKEMQEAQEKIELTFVLLGRII